MSQRVVVSRHLSDPSPRSPISNVRVAIILFIVAEVMLFGTLMAGYFVLRMGSNNFSGMGHLPVGLTGLSTTVLILSSVALIVARRAVVRGKTGAFKMASMGTLALGAIFLTLQLVEWSRLSEVGLLPAVAINSGLFFMLSGVHGLHVVGGLIILLVLNLRAFRGTVTPRRRGILDVSAAYWHFVTIVWVGLFITLFII